MVRVGCASADLQKGQHSGFPSGTDALLLDTDRIELEPNPNPNLFPTLTPNP